MHHIKIIGAGQIGSRHLQALAKVKLPLSIEVIDPFQASLETAKNRYQEVANGNPHRISFHQEIKEIQAADAVIIATSANSRNAVLMDLLNRIQTKHLILEKLLFSNEKEYETAASALARHPTKTWVNCCMRMIPYYQALQPRFLDTPINYIVQGSNFGLITNAIHYLDHLAYLSGCHEFTIDCNYLDANVIPSKRQGFFEVTGSLLAKFANGSTAMITSHAEGSAPIQVQISNHVHRIISREWQNLAYEANLQNNWTWQETAANILFQSQLTTDLIEGLLQQDSCPLPSFTESSKIHLQLLKPLKKFLQDKQLRTDCDFPFT